MNQSNIKNLDLAKYNKVPQKAVINPALLPKLKREAALEVDQLDSRLHT
jgi:hypothetical protein